ncbi:hypothetical protein [Phreatobacter stygius]|uniref:Uncharacterized protein n=1 Tax=Phreatobacter stygius TaxID=1940610 RepID=A0A4D7B7M0_9HYPH|nr:hypothetical protein [Phreatobacter stygius]QCI66985.1 hypothetical protein E8M01_23715 [Phreatobacter stygius]
MTIKTEAFRGPIETFRFTASSRVFTPKLKAIVPGLPGRPASADQGARVIPIKSRPNPGALVNRHVLGRPRATWRVSPASGRLELCWSLDTGSSAGSKAMPRGVFPCVS